MNDTISSDDREFLAALQRSGPQCVKQLCETHGVTPTAVRHRLGRLLDQGLVVRTAVRGERGRPHHEYSVTHTGQRALGDDYASLARLLWREVRKIEPRETRERLVAGVRSAMVSRYRSASPAEAIGDRFDQLQQSLEREGFEVESDRREVDEELLPILREHACPYHDLAAEDRSICELEKSVFEEVLGVPVRLTQCCHDGDNCCEFEPALSG